MLHNLGRGLTLAASFLQLATAAATIIDCGSAQDRNFVGGNTWTTGPASDVTLRFGSTFRYSIPTPAGRYSVTLRFIEPSVTAANQRIFSVLINGVLAVDRLDLVAVAGFMQPHVRAVEIVVPASGILDVSFTTQVRSAVISAIEYERLPDPTPTPATQVRAGYGIITFPMPDATVVSVDKSIVMHLYDAGAPAPAVGSGCNDSGGMFVLPDAVYLCAPVLPELPTPRNPWGRWIRLVAQ